MKTSAWRSRALPFALAALLVVALLPLRSQSEPPLPPDEEEVLEPAPPAPWEDPGFNGDPTPKEDLSTLGEPLEEGTGDPALFVEDVPLPDGFAALSPSQTATPATCEGYTGAVTPLAVASNRHYFSFGQQPVLMVGVSADNGCHLDLEDSKKCIWGNASDPARFPKNYPAILADAKARGLNKIRLWVAFGGDPNDPSPTNDAVKQARNQPFLKESTYYRLDQPNRAFFDALRTVVIETKRNDQFVEVTFFSPFQGDKPDTKSLWLARNHLARAPKADGSGLEEVGFSDLRWFALKSDASRPQEERMRQYQKNVIDWTIKWLWCYDNVYWEVANEPERQDADALLAVEWQKQMIAHVKAEEAKYTHLTARRPIAVQPFKTKAADKWKELPSGGCNESPPVGWNGCRPDVINGHYTQVASDSATAFPPGTLAFNLDLGAIRLIRDYGKQQKIFGLNEDNITPFSGSKGTRTLKTDVIPIPATARDFGVPDPVRAEAWEFLLGGGGAFDHFGYLYNSTNGVKVRDQLGKIRGWLTALPVFSLQTSPSAPNPMFPNTPPGAVWADIGAYPKADTWDPLTLSRKHWAAMETPGWQTAGTGRKFLLYVHRSTPRCVSDNDDFDRRPHPVTGDPVLKCAGKNLSFDAYDGRRRPSAGARYQEADLRLHLGSRAGTFDVAWLDAANPAGAPLLQEQIQWQPSPEACRGASPCRITSPKYPYDLLLRIVQR